jgi:hypothetical protein
LRCLLPWKLLQQTIAGCFARYVCIQNILNAVHRSFAGWLLQHWTAATATGAAALTAKLMTSRGVTDRLQKGKVSSKICVGVAVWVKDWGDTGVESR